MAYNFKRLAEVDSATDIQASDSFLIEQNGQVKKANLTNTEEIVEVPETAKALVEVDGVIKRTPFSSGGGGNANLEDMCFDLDCTTSSTSLSFSDMSQIQKVLDNHMSITIIYSYVSSGISNVAAAKYASLTDSLIVGSASMGLVYSSAYPSFYEGNQLQMSIGLDATDYESDILTASNTYVYNLPSGYTLLRAYASIF